MKNLYPKSKGKVYPSPSSPSPSTPDSALSVLNFLPAAILALASILSLEDREVLAYLITTNTNSSYSNPKKTKCKKPNPSTHKPPVFDCGCFECYTRYWFRWDSSPNRELIHQVLEAFEDHSNSSTPRSKNTRGKKRDKPQLVFDKTPTPPNPPPQHQLLLEPETPTPEMEALPESEEYQEEEEEGVSPESEEMVQQVPVSSCNHKGLARKVLPDVMGLFNSRIWNLWSTNI